MIVTDPIADMLTRIRNAINAKHESVLIPASKEKLAIAEILLEEGYISSFELESAGAFKNIKVVIKYDADNQVLSKESKEFQNLDSEFIAQLTKSHKLSMVLELQFFRQTKEL